MSFSTYSPRSLRVCVSARSRAARARRVLPAIASLALGASVALVACIDPAQDYQDFVTRTNDKRGVTAPSDAAAAESSAIDGGFSSVYFVACLPALAGGKVNLALLFQASVVYAPSEPGSKKGTLDLHLTPLVAKTTELSNTVGPAFGTPSPVAVDAQGNFTADFGAVTLPAAANPVQTSDVVFSSASVKGLLLRDDFLCDDLFGEVTAPAPLTFSGGNYCLFFRHDAPSGAVETLTADQFHCP